MKRYEESWSDINDRVIDGIIRGAARQNLVHSLYAAGEQIVHHGIQNSSVDQAALELYELGKLLDAGRWLHAFPRMTPQEVAFYRENLTYAVQGQIDDMTIMRDCYYYKMAVLAAIRFYRWHSNDEGHDNDTD